MLQNEYLVAKIGVDTAENEPSKVSGGSEFHPAVSHTDPTGAKKASAERGKGESPSSLAAARATLHISVKHKLATFV